MYFGFIFFNMKRLLIVMIALTLSASALFANLEFTGTSLTGGYSSAFDNGMMGFNAEYMFSMDITKSVLMGFGTHADLSFVFGDNNPGLGVGVIVGPVLTLAPDDMNSINLLLGPAMYNENGYYGASYLGMGLGADLSYTYSFSGANSVGITLGATSYLMFYNSILGMGPGAINPNFVYALMGYVGVNWKLGARQGSGTTVTYY